jgi:subtilisin family serine protease
MIAVTILAGLFLAAGIARTAPPPEDPCIEGEALVQWHSVLAPADLHAAARRGGLSVQRHFAVLSRESGRAMALLRHPTQSTAELVAALRADPAVAVAEPNYLRRPCATNLVPNDPDFPLLWGLRNTGQTVEGATGTAGVDIAAPAAWALLPAPAMTAIVAILDTGYDGAHPELLGNLWRNPGEIPADGFDNDGNGYTNDYRGYDFATPDADPLDAGDHGTHVAGTIGAAGRNALGGIGVNWRATLMPLKISGDGDFISAAAEIAALEYAILMKQRGANIVAINASYGGNSFSVTESNAIAAAGAAGIVFCAAAGNGDGNGNGINTDTSPFYPACYAIPTIVAVAAIDARGQLAPFSNYGTNSTDIAAPGVSIYSTMPLNLATWTRQVQAPAKTYAASGLQYAGLTAGVTGTLHDCGLGYPADFPAAVSGQVALIQRGTLTFSEKVANAAAAGARAVALYNSSATAVNGTLQYADAWLPAVMLAKNDGNALKALGVVTVTVVNAVSPAAPAQFMDGTSMATPHVAGAVALAAMIYPTDTAAQRLQRVLAAATPVPGLASKVQQGRRLNLERLLDSDGDQLPDWWEWRYFGSLTNGPATDADEDGMNLFAEWQAGTIPTSGASRLTVAFTGAVADAVTLCWPSVEDRSYTLESSTHLVTGFTRTVGAGLPATPPLNVLTDPAATNGQPYFYRVRVE